MKSFSAALVLASSFVLANAQISYHNGTIFCKDPGFAAYCAGGNIIIRCANGIGYPGNCNDNLANEPPFGDNGNAGCYQSSKHAGDAACTKAGLVYPSSGAVDASNADAPPFPIPGTIAGTNSSMPTNTTSSRVSMGTGLSGPNYLSTGVAGPYQTTTIMTTVTIVTDCGNGETTSTSVYPIATQVVPISAHAGHGHYWSNYTAAHPALTAAPVVISTTTVPIESTITQPTEQASAQSSQQTAAAASGVAAAGTATLATSASTTSSYSSTSSPESFTGAADKLQSGSWLLAMAGVLLWYAI